uniref:Uncharacterized protein n=1 Tax=Micrurus lemniscatus lemniscatus TaxID=129467 RepID=A0A2D4I8E7_MICLE
MGSGQLTTWSWLRWFQCSQSQPKSQRGWSTGWGEKLLSPYSDEQSISSESNFEAQTERCKACVVWKTLDLESCSLEFGAGVAGTAKWIDFVGRKKGQFDGHQPRA